jgi:site-specific DNA-methyltransferase (adenine-specific)
MSIKYIDINSITIEENRHRKEFTPEAMADLSDSISRIGLLHPIVVEGTELKAGERRLRAIKNLYVMGVSINFGPNPVDVGFIPCVQYHDLDAITKMEIQVDENQKRENLTWQESALATSLLAELRSAQATRDGTTQPKVSEIAAEIRGTGIGGNLTRTHEALIVAKHLDNPEVAKAKTQKDAIKVLRKAETAKRHEAHAAVIGRSYSAANHRLYNLDSVAWMKTQEANQFDVILTDAPYGMDAQDFGDSGLVTLGNHQYDDSWETVSILLKALLTEGFRITRPNAHLYLFCDIDHFIELKMWAAAIGWRVFRTPLIWSKPNAYRAPWPTSGPRRTYETILYAVKGDKLVTKLLADVLVHNVDENLGHAAQKPVALFIDLLGRSVQPGDKVFDPFAGTGTIFEAATALKCYATGIELEPSFYGIALERLEKIKCE